MSDTLRLFYENFSCTESLFHKLYFVFILLCITFVIITRVHFFYCVCINYTGFDERVYSGCDKIRIVVDNPILRVCNNDKIYYPGRYFNKECTLSEVRSVIHVIIYTRNNLQGASIFNSINITLQWWTGSECLMALTPRFVLSCVVQ